MRNSTINRRIKESRRLYVWIVFWSAVMVGSIFALVQWFATTTRHDYTSFSIFSTAFITAVIAILLAAVMVANLNTGERPPPEPPQVPPPRDISELLDVQNVHRPGQVSLHYAEDAHIRISHMKLTKRQWRTLAERMSAYALTRKRNYWTWRRKDLEGLVTSITAPGVYKQLTRDMEKIGVVKNGRVTTGGRDAICEAAGFEVVI
jgi:hypothetical protein